MIKAFKRISDWLDMVSVRVAAGMVAVILALTILGAISRYIFRSPLSWPLAVDQILMIWAALLGIPAALKRGEHMGVEALFKALPGKAEVILRYFDYIMIFVFTAILFWYGWLQFKSTGDTYMLTQNVEISSKWLVAAIPVGALIQLVHLLTIPYLIEAEKEKYAAYLEQ
jgi:TRAP-type C4-dicarboxylate transport system permease small subunit